MFKRKIYDKLVRWKNESDGETAVLIDGARRVGKSTVAEAFGKNGIFEGQAPMTVAVFR